MNSVIRNNVTCTNDGIYSLSLQFYKLIGMTLEGSDGAGLGVHGIRVNVDKDRNNHGVASLNQTKTRHVLVFNELLQLKI